MEALVDSKEKIRKFIMENIVVFEDEAVFSDHDDIFKLGLVNSIFTVRILNYLEKEFQIEIEEEDMELTNFSSIQMIIQFIQSKRNGD